MQRSLGVCVVNLVRLDVEPCPCPPGKPATPVRIQCVSDGITVYVRRWPRVTLDDTGQTG